MHTVGFKWLLGIIERSIYILSDMNKYQKLRRNRKAEYGQIGRTLVISMFHFTLSAHERTPLQQ
jgi:hypothetical protein